MTRTRRPRFSPRAVSALRLAAGLILGGAAGAAFAFAGGLAWFADGRGFLVVVVGLLLLALPLNGLSVGRKLKTHGAMEPPPRIALYLTTALLWALIAGLALLGAALPNGWITLAPFAPPQAPAWAGIGLSLLAVLAMAAWAHDVGVNRRKRARLRLLYRGGTHLVAPRADRELAVFRGAALISSAGEEIAYRFALMGVLSVWLGPLAALLLSSVAFAAGHAYQGLRAGAATGLFGLTAGVLTLAAGSIWPAIVLHVAWNQVVGGVLREVYRRRA